ncbi:rhodanese-like domain-containing protein [Desulfocurvus sp. DL9XJH121]
MRLYTPRLVFLYQALMLGALALALAWTVNANRPDSLPWLGAGPAPSADAEAVPSAPEIGVDEAMALFAGGTAVFVDARYAEDYAAGHIPGAVNVPMGLFEDEIAAILGPHGRDAQYVVYCTSESCPLAAELALALGFMEYSDVSVFTGGMAAWTAAGGEVEVAQ